LSQAKGPNVNQDRRSSSFGCKSLYEQISSHSRKINLAAIAKNDLFRQKPPLKRANGQKNGGQNFAAVFGQGHFKV